ncbi:MAG: hypothetical protein WBX19_05370 [Terracidiphilus sp.]
MEMIKLDKSSFMNVALEIFSRSDLKPIADAFGSKVTVFYLGKEFGLFKAYFYPGWQQSNTPETGILRYCKLIQKLPKEERKLWDSAKSRSFDLGFEGPQKGRRYWGAVGQKAVRAAAEVGAQIAITIYGPMKVTKQTKKKRAARAK